MSLYMEEWFKKNFGRYFYITSVLVPKTGESIYVLKDRDTGKYVVNREGDRLKNFRDEIDAIDYAKARSYTIKRLKRVL